MFPFILDFLDKQFWQQFVGIVLGIPVALLIERRIEAKKQQAERADLVQALTDALQKNLALIQQIQNTISVEGKEGMPTFSVDLTILDATAARKYELLGAVATVRSVDHARYELTHLAIKLITFREEVGRIAGIQQAGSYYYALKESINKHLPIVQKALESAITSLKYNG